MQLKSRSEVNATCSGIVKEPEAEFYSLSDALKAVS